jgi:hypothetical protein
MSGRWFFTRGEGDVIELRARFEGEGGMVGDAYDEIRPGQKALNVTHQELFAAGAGVLVIEDGKARIVTP